MPLVQTSSSFTEKYFNLNFSFAFRFLQINKQSLILQFDSKSCLVERIVKGKKLKNSANLKIIISVYSEFSN